MYVLLSKFKLDLPLEITSLILNVLIGAVIFITVNLCLWLTSNKAEGPETIILNYINNQFDKLRKKNQRTHQKKIS